MTNLLSRINRKNIFLIDGLGAFLSAFSLGVSLPLLRDWVGMPATTLYFLAIIALFFSIYSLSRFYFSDCKNNIWLKIIIFFNLSYCGLTTYLVCVYFNVLKPLGLAYFFGEIAIILVLVAIEFWTLKNRFTE